MLLGGLVGQRRVETTNLLERVTRVRAPPFLLEVVEFIHMSSLVVTIRWLSCAFYPKPCVGCTASEGKVGQGGMVDEKVADTMEAQFML